MSAPRFYGFISNSYTAALVGPDGSVDWFPCPRFDSAAVFCRLLDDARGGFFAIRPEGPWESRQQYLDQTNLLKTTFQTPDGQATILDFLPIGRTAIWRIVETPIPLVLTCRPTFNFGSCNAAYQIEDTGALFRHPAGTEALRLMIDGPHTKREQRDQWTIGPGHVVVVLRYAQDAEREAAQLTEPLTDESEMIQRTKTFWLLNRLPYQGPWAEAFHQSVMVLRGLTYRTNGAMVAAATTSLPEIIGAERQWDYRFVWVRDAAYGAEALLLAGDPVGCRRYLEFIFNTVDLVGKPFAAPFYRVDGTVSHGEQEIGWLAGYRNTRPVRIGNAASGQLQLDVAGDFLWVVYLYWLTTQDHTFIRDYWWAIETLVHWVAGHWQQEDASLWEFRDDDDRYTHSQVMCWVALKAGQVFAEKALALPGLANHWAAQAQHVREDVWDHLRQSGVPYLTQGPRHPQLDAALLTLPLYGFLAPDDPVFRETLTQIENALVVDDRVYRYRQDNLGTAAHPFTLAGFWLARVYHRLGQADRRDALITAQIASMTDLGLFAEHIDRETGEPRGNFPQLFPHAGLITTLVERQNPSAPWFHPWPD